MRTIVSVILLCISLSVYSQNRTASQDTVASIVSVEGTWLKSKVYLKCMLKNQKEDGFLVFEVMKNGSYQYVGNTAVLGVPVEFPLLYCFNYEDPEFKTSEFRVTCITPGKNKVTSVPFKVERAAGTVETAVIGTSQERSRDKQ